MNRRTFCTTGMAGAGTVLWPRLLSAAASERPNILYIMADDHSSRAISCYGSNRNRTPNIDRLAHEGVRMTNCFCTNSLCAPSRASIITGRYSHMNGVRTLSEALDTSIVTFPRLLRQAGYQTGVVGKWHLSRFKGNSGPEPKLVDFDYSSVLAGQGTYYDPVMWENGVKKEHTGYATDIITDLSLGFLEKRKKDKPFLMLVHHKSPHGPWEPAERHKHLYEDQPVPEPPTFWDDYSHRSKAVRESERTISALADRLGIQESDPKVKKTKAYQQFSKDYLRCVASVDESVGRLLDWVDNQRLRENTIVVYTSDQGAFVGEHGFYDKRLMYEDALRMPFLMRYPREIKAGGVCDRMLLNVDFAETFLDFAGIAAPEGMQGRSFRPVVRGKTPKDWRKSMFYRYYIPGLTPPHYGVRNERYKLIHFFQTGEWELYDLKEDPLEVNSVYDRPQYAAVVAQMKAEMDRLCRELKVTKEELALLPRADRKEKKLLR